MYNIFYLFLLQKSRLQYIDSCDILNTYVYEGEYYEKTWFWFYATACSGSK